MNIYIYVNGNDKIVKKQNIKIKPKQYHNYIIIIFCIIDDIYMKRIRIILKINNLISFL